MLLEIGFGLIIRKRNRNISHFGSYTEDYFINDSNLGYKSKPSSRVNSIKIINQDTIYNVYYTTDDYSRRVNFPVNTDSLKYYAIFFGGSITFGEGINDNETFVSKFNLYNPDYYSYNYGFCGYGPNQMLAKLKDINFREEVKYNSGICVYTFIDEHIKRILGSMSIVSAWAEKTPYYKYDKTGNLVRKENFKDNRILKTAFFKIIGSSNLIKYFNIDIPGKLKPKHYKLAADIFKESYETYKEKFSNDNFYVVVFPGSSNEMVKYLKNMNIKTIDLSGLYSKFQYRLNKLDLHPNKKGHEIFAKKLQDILLIN